MAARPEPEPLLFAQRQQQRDLRYISTPEQWHTWPLCPLVRRTNGSTELAYMVVGLGPIICHGNIHAMRSAVGTQPDRQEEFTSYAAIIAAGWQVD
jgi:hypothetical protein